ncbi:MAG: iron-sulfur cluster assembly protein [Bacteroidota bacterium]
MYRDFLIDGRDDLDHLEPHEQEAVEVFRSVYDPEIPVPIWDLGLIYGLDTNVEGQTAHVKMTLTAPNCPAAELLPQQVRYGLEALDWCEDATVEIVFTPPFNQEMISDEAKLTMGLI